jgi:hypothetical protein
MIASSLFHFTKEIDTIIKIIEGKSLRPSLNLESVQNFFPGRKYIATPMVCFCDIPLKFISDNHTERYGTYGLGFKKDWGIQNKVSPILYSLENSDFSNSFSSSSLEINKISKKLETLNSLSGQGSSELQDIQYILSTLNGQLENMAGFIKPYKGSFENEARNNYLDREWRWVPEDKKKEFHEFGDEEFRKKLNQEYHSKFTPLEFDIADLNYLIVKQSEDIGELIRKIIGLDLSEEEKFILSQKIIDINSINSDM